MAVHIGNGRTHPRLRTRWLGANLAVALAALQLFSPAAAIAQDGEAPTEPAATQTATDSIVSPDAAQDAVPATVPAADAVDPAAAAAATWYVDGNSGADGAACNSAGAPCRTIQDAINRAGSGDTILVAGNASGIVYTFAAAGPCTNGLGANVVACVNDKKLTIRGGYTQGSFAAYSPSQNLSIIDGQGKNRGVAVLGFSNVPGTALDIGGFTVRSGYGTGIGKRSGVGSYFGFGGGMLVENVGTVTLRDMVFDSNRAVGGDRGSGEGGAGAGGGASFHTATVNLENVRLHQQSSPRRRRRPNAAAMRRAGRSSRTTRRWRAVACGLKRTSPRPAIPAVQAGPRTASAPMPWAGQLLSRREARSRSTT